MQIWLQDLCQSSHGFRKGALAPREEERNVRNSRSPPQIPRFEHRVLIAVERGHLYVLIVVRQKAVLLPLRLLQPGMSSALISGSLRPRAEGERRVSAPPRRGERGPLAGKGQKRAGPGDASSLLITAGNQGRCGFTAALYTRSQRMHLMEGRGGIQG